jgi:adenylate kinase family enzyme
MKRVVVVGNGGSGKSTLARELGEILGLEVIHLDVHFWRPGWVATPRAQWRESVAGLVAREAWVMDGSYAGTTDIRFPAADTIVFLDFSRGRCLWQALARLVRHWGRNRPDLAPGCPEKFDWPFLKWIWRYPSADRPLVLAQIARHAEGRTVVALRTPREVRRWLDGIREGRGDVAAVKSHLTSSSSG